MLNNVSNFFTNVKFLPNFTIISNAQAVFFYLFKTSTSILHLDSKIILKNIKIHNYAIPSALSVISITFFIFIKNYPKPLENEKNDIYFRGMRQIITQQNEMINSKFREINEKQERSNSYISSELSKEYNQILNDYINPNRLNILIENRTIISKLHILSSKLFESNKESINTKKNK